MDCEKNAAVMMVTCLLRAGPVQEEGRKRSTKEELMLPCSDASQWPVPVVSSL